MIHSAGKTGIFPSHFGRESMSNRSPYFALCTFTVWTCLLLVAFPDLRIAVKFYTIGQWFFFLLVMSLVDITILSIAIVSLLTTILSFR